MGDEEVEAEEMEGPWEAARTNYPAKTFNRESVGNHHPVMMALPKGEQAPCVRTRMLKLKGISAEQWEEKEEKVLSLLNERGAEIETAARGKNPSRLHAIKVKIIEEVLRQHYTKRGPTGTKL